LINVLSDKGKIRTLKISMAAIISVVVVEFLLGFVVGSLAILSDGLHAAFDALTTFILIITTAASLKPPDEEHMYGHEKFEPIGGLIGGIALVITSIIIFYEAFLRLFQNVPINLELSYAGFIAIGYTLCMDFLRVGALRGAFKSESATMKSGLYHATADLGSTLIALFGFGMASVGFNIGDALASIILSIPLAYLSVKLIWNSGLELSDVAPMDVVKKIRREIVSTKGVLGIRSLKVRRVGAKTFAEITLQVPEYLGLEESHELASRVEENLKKSLGNAEVVIHVEPPEKEMLTEKLVEKLAEQVEGVKDVHEVNVIYAGGRLHLTLHARVNAGMSVQGAHEIAEKIEERIRAKMGAVDHITVHIEPFEAKMRGTVVDERKFRQVIHDIVKSFDGVLSLKRMVTYVVCGKRYVDLDCCFTGEIPIEEAHRVASEIENSIKEKFTEVVVTVHIEPERNGYS